MTKIPVPSEHAEQKAVIVWCQLLANQHNELHWIYAIPNGGQRHPAIAAKLKREGVRAGVPDLCLPIARGEYHGLYIELKRQRGGQTSENQKFWIDGLRENGYRAEVAKGASAAIKLICEYLRI